MADEKKETAVAVVEEHTPAPKDNSAEALISQAIEKGVDVGTMERLLAMRRELQKEFAKKEFDKAMAAFQADCPTIKKTREVKTRSGVVAYRYAPIESIVFQIKDMLKRHGFSYTTQQQLMEAGVKITVKVTHEAGHSEENSMEVPFGSKTDIMSQSQVAAAATTFAKRYAFCNAFGILTGDEDNDARPMEEAPAETPAENKFKTALRMVRESKNLDALVEYREKLKGSKSFTAAQKKELSAALHDRIAALEPNIEPTNG